MNEKKKISIGIGECIAIIVIIVLAVVALGGMIYQKENSQKESEELKKQVNTLENEVENLNSKNNEMQKEVNAVKKSEQNKQNKIENNTIVNNNQINNMSNKTETVSKSELEKFLYNNVGFLSTEYLNVKTIDLFELISSTENLTKVPSEEERQELEKVNGVGAAPLHMVNKDAVIEYISKNSYLLENEIKEKLSRIDEYIYIDKYNSYFFYRADAPAVSRLGINISSYNKIRDNVYEIVYNFTDYDDYITVPSEISGNRQVTLEKVDNGYHFISNIAI